ncbi:MAG: class I SAM-dependent methyltransferase [Chloroflexi bacterium]|nr:class I SAM-dependent methyltransferase [Chloroflexota bacterium]
MADDGPTKQAQWQKLIDYILGYQATWIADIGVKTGLFQAIADAGSSGIHEGPLARKLSFDARYTGVWCRGAYAFQFLDWDRAKGYRLAPHMQSLLLNEEDTQFLGGRIQFNAALYQDFQAFPKYLPTGETWPRSDHDPWLLEALKNMTKPDCTVITDHVLPQAPGTLARLKEGGAILDIGAGAGFAIVHYATRFPASRVVGLENDDASVDLARAAILEAGLAGRVQVRNADANSMDYDNAFDLVTMNVTLHEVGGPQAYRNVLSKALRALRIGGVLVVSELPYPDSTASYRDNPVYQMMAGVQLHEALVGCGMITQGQLRDLRVGAGFHTVRVADQPLATRFMMLAEKGG